jgi:hypothetical protein
MYLYIFADGTVRQVHDNISVADLIALKQGLLRIFSVVNHKFVRIVLDKEKICLVPVRESEILLNKDGRLHHL